MGNGGILRETLSKAVSRAANRSHGTPSDAESRPSGSVALSMLWILPNATGSVFLFPSTTTTVVSVPKSCSQAFSFTGGHWRAYRQWPFSYWETDIRQRTRRLFRALRVGEDG